MRTDRLSDVPLRISRGVHCWTETGCCPFFDDPECKLFERERPLHDANGDSLRLPACLSAYPNGATIEIKPKEASCK